jgi:putative ABC transport system permease protein
VIERLQALPDVAAAGMATALPALNDSGTASFAVEGWTPDRRDSATATFVAVTPGYFRALDMRLTAGRLLQDSDNQRAPRAVVVNETFARTYFGPEGAVGRRFRFVGRRGQVTPDVPWIAIVGVVADVAEDGLDHPVRPQIYQSLWQVSGLALALVARGQSAPPASAAVRRAVLEADPNLPLYAVRSGEELLATQLAQRRFTTYLVNVFGLSALFLAAFGLHGVIAYSVRQRTHEIGIRIALGATAGRVIALILGQAIRVTALGLALGLAGALAASQLVSTMLFNVRPGDPGMLAVVGVVLALVVGCGTVGAALRAARIEAAVALRQE